MSSPLTTSPASERKPPLIVAFFFKFNFYFIYYGLMSEIVLQGLLLKQQYIFLFGMMKMT